MNTHRVEAFRAKHGFSDLGFKVVDPLNLASREPQEVATVRVNARIALKTPMRKRLKACTGKQFIALFVRVSIERVPYLAVAVVRAGLNKLWRQFPRFRFSATLANQNNGFAFFVGFVYPLEERDTLQVCRAELLPIPRPSLFHSDKFGHAYAPAAHNLETVRQRQSLATLNPLRPMWCCPSRIAVCDRHIGKAGFVRPLNNCNTVIPVAG